LKPLQLTSHHLLFCDAHSCELVWDPAEARRKGINLDPEKDDLHNFVHNIREAAFLELARQDYNLGTLQLNSIHDLKSSDGSDWSQEQKEKFRGYIFRFRRNLQAVSKAMSLPLGVCHAYYLGYYKNTSDYVLLKAICIDERNGKASSSQQGFDVCSICGDGGSLIICDGCEGEYHMKCLKPPLRVVPEGQWLCDECVDRRVSIARDDHFRKSRLFLEAETNEATSKKRSLDSIQIGSNVEPKPSLHSLENTMSSLNDVYAPSPDFAKAVYTLSAKMQKILSSERDQIST
jgi:PHD-finger